MSSAYSAFWNTLCFTTMVSMFEVIVLTMILFPIALAAAISGLIFVNRNKVDVPQYEDKPAKPKEKNNQKKESKQQFAANIQDVEESDI